MLEDEGVDVHVTRSAAAFDDQDITADTTVVVTSSEQLGKDTYYRLITRAQGARLIFIEPSSFVTSGSG